jgi:hypothetical protein
MLLKRIRPRRSAFFLAYFVMLLSPVFPAGPDPVADISITPGQIGWTPNIKAEKWLLTVSGQGIYLREVVEAGEPLRLQPNAPDGERLADGSYNWELRAIVPERRESLAERDQKPSSVRQRSAPGELTFERRPAERPVVTSGSFRLERGGFVMPPPEDPREMP